MGKQGVNGLVVRCQRSCMRSSGRLSYLCPTGLEGNDRFAPAYSLRDLPEPWRIDDGLQVEQDHLGMLVLFPVLEQVIDRDIHMVAEAHKAGEPKIQSLCCGDHGKSQSPTFRRDCHVTYRWNHGCIGCIEPNGRSEIHQAETVRPDQANSRSPDAFAQLPFERGSGSTGLGESCRDQNDRRHLLRDTVIDDGQDKPGWYHDDGEIDVRRNLAKRRKGAKAGYLGRVRIDREDRSGEVTSLEGF